jgi:hypothetical protein
MIHGAFIHTLVSLMITCRPRGHLVYSSHSCVHSYEEGDTWVNPLGFSLASVPYRCCFMLCVQ